ncbi:MAG: glycoside hydrolase family 13 protein, partial [Clostridia bacterium]|nr:glycoside hydrolase family 13 protein [Clostridia bacterium]
GKKRLKLAALVLFCFPGSPTVYYGDETGMEGFEDPFNRQTYPWGFEDQELLAWFTGLGKARKESEALRRGDIQYVKADGPVLAFTRSCRGETVLCACNAGLDQREIVVPWSGETLTLPPLTGQMLKQKD